MTESQKIKQEIDRFERILLEMEGKAKIRANDLINAENQIARIPRKVKLVCQPTLMQVATLSACISILVGTSWYTLLERLWGN